MMQLDYSVNSLEFEQSNTSCQEVIMMDLIKPQPYISLFFSLESGKPQLPKMSLSATRALC